jgi:glyceraldehyde-3-phosphate dehydrogenase/erythrose-4-phosphate dehydrogenase
VPVAHANQALKAVTNGGKMIGWTNQPLVSSDFRAQSESQILAARQRQFQSAVYSGCLAGMTMNGDSLPRSRYGSADGRKI